MALQATSRRSPLVGGSGIDVDKVRQDRCPGSPGRRGFRDWGRRYEELLGGGAGSRLLIRGQGLAGDCGCQPVQQRAFGCGLGQAVPGQQR